MPDWKKYIRDHVTSLSIPPEREAEVFEELAQHLQAAYEEAIAEGMAADQARTAALAQFPDWRIFECELQRAERPVTGVVATRWRAAPNYQSQGRGGTRWPRKTMETLLEDVRFGARLLWKDKGFAVAAILTLALCIAANATIFCVIYSVVLKPLPLPESEQILFLHNSYPKVGVERTGTSVLDYYDRLEGIDVFEEQALYRSQGLTIGEEGSVEQVQGLAVTPSFFRLLRVKPQLGRIFTQEEGDQGNERKVILSHALWQHLFGGDKEILGKALRIYGQPYTIVGVMPHDFIFLDLEVRLWRPLSFTQEQKSEEARFRTFWQMIGRLKRGASLEQAQAQIDALNAANLERFPQYEQLLANAGFHTRVVPIQDDIVRDIKGWLHLLWGAVLFVLLIGVVNIANLVMARSQMRLKELCTRFALGASPWRVIRQLMTESVMLTTCSALIGLLLGYWGLRIVNALELDQIPRGGEIAMDRTVVIFVLGLAFVVGVTIGTIPVIHGLKVNLRSALHEAGRTGTGSRAARVVRNALVVAQVALALVLLITATLLLASFRQVLAINPGFVPEQVLTGSMTLTERYRDSTDLCAFMDRALAKIRTLPGVVAAGATDSIPFGNRYNNDVIFAEDYQMEPGESLISPSQIVVTPGYFKAMRIPLVEGRSFEERDAEDSTQVIIVDRQLARKFWPTSSPIGRRMWRPTSPEASMEPEENALWYNVIGVVDSIKQRALVDPDEDVGAYYLPYAQSPDSGITVVLRTAAESEYMIGAIRRAITELDAELPLYDVRTMEQRIDESLISRRSPMLLALCFGLVALFLAAMGIYGVLAYLVAQRTREIGLRMALGGTTRRIFGLILGEGILMVSIGLALGLLGTLVLARFLESLLHGVQPTDPTVLASVAMVLAVISIAACILPAQRATRVDPIVTLRQE